MARPRKLGMEYFPHDCDARNDLKIRKLRAVYGNDGYATFFILLENIYRNKDYELEVLDGETLLILSEECRVSTEKFEEILNKCLDLGLFDKEIYESRKAITSNAIKLRTEPVESERARKRNYKKDNYSKENISKDEVIDGETTGESAQSKVKESKVKHSKEKERKEENISSTPPPSFPTTWHQMIYEQFGEITYQTWFESTEFIEKGEVLEVITKDNLKRQMIRESLSKKLEVLFSKKILVREEP